MKFPELDPCPAPWKVLFAALLLGWIAPASLLAQLPVTLTRITGEEIRTTLTSLEDGVIGDGQNRYRLDELTTIQTDVAIAAKPSAIRVHLSGGGQLGADNVLFEGERFTVRCCLGELTLPSDCISAVVFQPAADLSRLQRALKNRSVELDTVIARTSGGQGVVQGLIESVSASKVVLNHNGRSRPVSLSKVVAIVTADLKPKMPGGTSAVLRLSDGSSISGAIGRLAGQQLDFHLAGNHSIAVDINRISMMSIKSGRVVYLSDLEPIDAEQNSLATVDFGWQRDRSVYGNPLRMHWPSTGETLTYARGIGTHAASRIEFANPGQFDRLVAIVGIDAETRGKGDCIVSVWADGIKLWESPISGATDPVPVDVAIGGMKSISLVVRNGKHLDLGDHVDWANVRLLRTTQ